MVVVVGAVVVAMAVVAAQAVADAYISQPQLVARDGGGNAGGWCGI